jgi:hypothetical protein
MGNIKSMMCGLIAAQINTMTKNKQTPAELCKAAGFKSLAEIAEITGVHEQTIRRWPDTKPLLWDAVLRGAAEIKRERQGV